MTKLLFVIASFSLMPFCYSVTAINYGKFLISPDVSFDGKSVRGEGYNFDNNKMEASKASSSNVSYIKWGSDTPVGEKVQYLTQAVLEKEGDGYSSGKVQTSSWYMDGKLRSTTKCRNVGQKASKSSSLELHCVTASAQACSSLLAQHNESNKKAASLENFKKEVNQCSDLLKDYAILAEAFSRTRNDDTRKAVVKSDTERVEDAIKDASKISKSVPSLTKLLIKDVFSTNKTAPKDLVDEMASSSKKASEYIQSIQDALELCEENKNNFRASGFIPSSINPKKVNGTDAR